jgi:hypothetical protein
MTMRRIVVLAALCSALAIVLLAPSGAEAAFPQCPPVFRDTSCQFLITVTDSGVQVAEDNTQGPYEGADDALIGIQNSSSKAISAIPLSAENSLFGFENDGLCKPGGEPVPAGCVVQPKNSLGAATANPGEKCPPGPEACSFPPPAGEPAGVTFPTGIAIEGFGANGDPVTGYEGPTSWFTGIAAPTFNSGVVNFSPALAPGQSTYFSLESPPTGKSITVGTASTLSTVLSGGGAKGPVIGVVRGTPVTDTATVGGTAAATASGKVNYKVFKDPACTQLAAEAGTVEVTNGVAAPSTPQSRLAAGKYYWQASYTGDINNQAASSPCGSEVLTVAQRVSKLGLPPNKKCFSKRHFIAHPRAPKHVRLIKVEVLINGVLKFLGKLAGKHTTVDLRGLPKGTFKVTMITESTTGATYGDTRTYHTCVKGKHKKLKK